MQFLPHPDTTPHASNNTAIKFYSFDNLHSTSSTFFIIGAAADPSIGGSSTETAGNRI